MTSALSELIDIRDGYKECDGLTCDDINASILDLCTNYFLCCTIVFLLLLTLLSIHVNF